LLKESNNTLTLEVESKEPGLLILAANYDKDWNATDNNNKTQILKANYYQQAIYLDKGKHLVEMAYKPVSFLIGSIISLITFLFLMALIYFQIVLKKNSPATVSGQ
jgi:uncharacterized membrane protein YfhO